MKKWKIFIVTAGQIVPEYYKNDPKFSNEHFSFFNVSRNKIEDNHFDIINTCDIQGYTYLGKDYAESEVIYNITKLDLFKEYDYIGIIHWDFMLFSKMYQTSRITENIDRILEKYDWISFFEAPGSSITGYYNVLMDNRKPNCLFVRDSNLDNPKSCNDYIAENTSIMIPDKIDGLRVSLCCSFLTSRSKFIDLGKYVSKIIDSRILDEFDTQKRHRFPGQFMERLVALYSSHEKKFNFTLVHKFTGGFALKDSDPNGENY